MRIPHMPAPRPSDEIQTESETRRYMSTVVCRVSCPAFAAFHIHEMTSEDSQAFLHVVQALLVFFLVGERRHDDARTHARPSA